MPSSPSDPAAYDPAAGEKLIIETPEQTSIEFPLAGIGSRFLAVLIDTLIQIAVLIVLGLIFVGLGFSFSVAGFGQSSTAAVWISAILIFVYFLLMYGYFMMFESIWNGQTPGKRLTHLRVIKDSGQPITAIDAVARNLLRLVDQLPFAYGIGVLCTWISPQSKRLGDYVAGTVVVHEKPFETVAPQWDAPAQSATHQYGANRLTPEEFALVETFLSRRSALEAGVRYDTAASIVRRIESKLTLPPEGKPSAEKLLEELSYERRSTAGYR
ncbi:MAG TPA: RDD family protein [Verrucomicrobiae bacterium]|nr:RDD family protein [Verrucomicrobiae bacterium]